MSGDKELLKSGKATFRIDEEGIIRQEYNGVIDLSIEDSRSELLVFEKYCRDKTRPALIDIRMVKTVQRESRLFYASEEPAKYISAAALLIGNPVSRIIGNFFMGVNRTILPVKLFSNKEEALKWLRTFL